MVKQLQFFTLNVFSESGINGGNQLAVIPDAKKLSTEQMQSIARQFNYSESTFVTKSTDTNNTVRIFLPTREIPYAGHPTIGTSFVLEYMWRKNFAARDTITLDLGIGPVKVTIACDDNYVPPDMVDVDMSRGIGMVTMQQKLSKNLGEYDDRAHLADLLGITTNDMLDMPLSLIAPDKDPVLMVPLKSVETVARLQPDYSGMIKTFKDSEAHPYVFAMKDEQTVRARYFAPTAGVNEDPATGSAQVSLALYLHQQQLIENQAQFVTEQGYAMGRPSRLHNSSVFDGTNLVSCSTGGYNHLVSTGTLWTD